MTENITEIGPCARCGRSCEPDEEGLCSDCQVVAHEMLDELNAGHARIVGDLADYLRESRREQEEAGGKWTWLLFPAMNAWLLYVEPVDYGLVVLVTNAVALLVLLGLRYIERLDDETIARGDELRRRYGHLLADRVKESV